MRTWVLFAVVAATLAVACRPGAIPGETQADGALPLPGVAVGGGLAPRAPSHPDQPAEPQPPAVTMVRTGERLPEGLLPEVGAINGVGTVSPVLWGQALLTSSRAPDGRIVDQPRNGFAIPLELIGIDPESYSQLVPVRDQARFRQLSAGRALLGTTAARLRRLGPGAALHLSTGQSLTVEGVVDDRLIRSAEVVVTQATAHGLGIEDVRYALLAVRDQQVTRAISASAARYGGVRAMELGRAPWNASWRSILPQVVIKERFGEFAFAPAENDWITVDPDWVQANIVTAPVPILGQVTCHRAMIPALAAAMADLEREGLAHTVVPDDFAGCYAPGLIKAPGNVSRHAWGLAVDINASRNPLGSPSQQDPRLVAVMERHGFGFGGRWGVPDPMHFEYHGLPR